MQQVSKAYLDAINKRTRSDRIQVEMITESAEVQCVLTDEDIEEGTLTVSRQCVNNGYFEFGAAYASELKFHTRTDKLVWSSLVGRYLRVTYGLQLSDGTYEEVPVGVFRITECSFSKDGLRRITAYDCLVTLDWELYFLSTSGNSPYQVLQFALDITTQVEIAYGMKTPKVTLGNTKEEIESMPNGTLPLPTSDDIKTPRECISAVAEILGCFVEADRTVPNKIWLRRFRTDTVFRVIPPDIRFSYDVDIDWDRPCDVSTQIRYLDDGSERTSSYTYTAKGDGAFFLTGGYRMILDNKILNLMGETNAKKAADNLASELTRINQKEYLPVSFAFFGDPSLDPGDMVTCAYNGTEHPTLIGSTVWNYRNTENVTAISGNKTTDISQSKSGLKNETSSGASEEKGASAMRYYTYGNAERIAIADGSMADIAAIRVLSYRATTIVFHAEIRLDVSTTEIIADDLYTCTDGILTAAYFAGSVEIGKVRPQWTLQDGVHTLHLFYSFGMTGYAAVEFHIRLYANGCSVDIPAQCVQAVLEGTYLAGEEAWDGLIDLNDTVKVSVGSAAVNVSTITDTAQIQAADVMHQGCADTVAVNVQGDAVTVSGFSETMQHDIAEEETT